MSRRLGRVSLFPPVASDGVVDGRRGGGGVDSRAIGDDDNDADRRHGVAQQGSGVRRHVLSVGLAFCALLSACTGTDDKGKSSPATSSATSSAAASDRSATRDAGASTMPTSASATETSRAPEPRPRFAADADDPGKVPQVPDDPVALATLLAAAETAVRDPHGATQLVAAARTQQACYRSWGQQPDWDAIVLGRVPSRLRAAAQANLTARRELVALYSQESAPERVPRWQIIGPAPPGDLLRFYRSAGSRYGLDWTYLAAINLVETTFGRVHGDSTAGAQGPMQFIPSTWAAYGDGGDVNDPHDAILGAARYLADRGIARDVDGALYGYNPTPLYGAAVKAYASVLRADPAAFAGYYNWDVYARTAAGPLLLPVGLDNRAGTLTATAYAAQHPERRG